MREGFNKRIFTPPLLLATVHQLSSHLGDLRAAVRHKRVGRAFAEKIMLAVTRVNGCRYCSYGHSRLALAAGVSETELQMLMAGEYGELPEHQVIALSFAEHYAEQQGQPDPQAWQRLVDVYGPETARDILAYIRMITFGNLLGNTFDALLSRFTGKPAPGSSFLGEVWVLVYSLTIFPLVMLARMVQLRFLSRDFA